MNEYTITIGLDNPDDNAARMLADLASDAEVRFDEITRHDDPDMRWAYDATLSFCATPTDVARYLAYYDAPDDAITLA